MISHETSNKESAIKLEVTNLTKELQVVRRKTNEYKLIKDAIFECLKMKGILSPKLHSNIVNILMNHEISKSIDLNSECSLLTSKSLESSSITYEEGQNLKNVIEVGLKKKRQTIFEELKEVGIKQDEIHGKNVETGFDVQYQVLTEMKTSLNRKQQMYVTNLNDLVHIYDEIIQLKVNKMPSILSNQVDILQTNSNKLRLRAEFLNSSARVTVFTENCSSLGAYDEILKDVNHEQKKCNEDIKNLQILKEKYKQVSSKQYNEILGNYLQYKNRVENFKK